MSGMNVRYHFPLFWVLVGILFSPIKADDAVLDQHQENEKAIHDYHVIEAKLDKTYKARLAAEKNEVKRQKLSDSQKAWKIYRDTEAAYKFYVPAGEYEGSGYPQRFYSCLIRLTEERIKELSIEE